MWLYSRSRDLFILAMPALVTLVAFGISGVGGDGPRLYAGWIAQFALGNSTHVILTFLLLGMRRDMLRATPGQAMTVIAGSSATFVASFAFFWWSHRAMPMFEDFATAVVLVFATHHTLSQAKGIWSLYTLRSKQPPSDRERKIQKAFVPIALVLILTRWFFVPKGPDRLYPFMQPIPGVPAVFPFWTTFALMAPWLVVAAIAIGSVRGIPKRIYVSTHMVGVLAMIALPGWGAVFTAGIHGLEYYFLCGRMLEPRKEGERGWVIPAMIFSMLPLVAIGFLNAPFVSPIAAAEPLKWLLNSVVMAHYFADAFIYRFRISEVRRVALARLGFA